MEATTEMLCEAGAGVELMKGWFAHSPAQKVVGTVWMGEQRSHQLFPRSKQLARH